MRVLTSSLVAVSLLLCASDAWAVARTSTRDGTWCAADTWYPPGVPDASDQVFIVSGHHIVLDGACTQIAADLTLGPTNTWPLVSTLSTIGGQTLTVGDPIATYAIWNRRAIELTGGDRLEIDCDAVATSNCEVTNGSMSRFVAHGVQMGSGVVLSVSGENCPANSDFLPEAAFRATDCTDVSIEVDGLGLVQDDDPRFVGRYIRFGWPSPHRGTWYTFRSGREPECRSRTADRSGCSPEKAMNRFFHE